MNHVKITDHATPTGQEFMAGSYPGSGVYLNRKTRTIYLVHAPAVYSLPTQLEQFLEPLDEQFATVTSTLNPGFSEDFILKALAIAQSPQLAVNLLVKPA